MTFALLLACAPAPAPTADSCAACHAEVHDAWAGSAHGRGPSEVFDAWLPEVEAQWGDASAARCTACHEPGFVPGETVGCAACHLAVGNHGAADGALVVDPDADLGGSSADAPHPLVDRPFLKASALCATCHEVTGPDLLVETTGSEHAAAGGDQTCADCHLQGHAFDPLRGEGLALTLVVERGVARVTLQNDGAGHSVPTGPSALRDVWVDLSFAPRVLTVGPRPMRGDHEVALLTDADHVEGEALRAGRSVSVQVVLPDDVDPRDVTATLWTARVRASAASALGVDPGAEVVTSVGGGGAPGG